MKKFTIQFLIIAFILSYLCFGFLALSNIGFGEILLDPLYLFLLALGFLGPFIASLIVFFINKDELGGLHGFMDNFKPSKSSKSIIWIFIFLSAHYIIGILFNNVGAYGNVLDFIKYLPLTVLFLGSQEIGWRNLVQPVFEKQKGYFRSIIITGLFWSLWFLPLIFIKGFIVLPQFYAQFAAYLIGLSFLLTALYRVSKSILYCTILSSLVFALVPVIIFKQGFILMAIAAIEGLLAIILKDKEFV